jgi:hypothetical protein
MLEKITEKQTVFRYLEAVFFCPGRLRPHGFIGAEIVLSAGLVYISDC